MTNRNIRQALRPGAETCLTVSVMLNGRKSRGAHLDPSTDAPALVGIIEGEPGRFRVARALQIQAVSAERSIWIASAYFTPSYSEVEALNGAARDGVDVRILVPSRYDHPWIRLLTRQFYRRLLMNGVRIWEWKGEMTHATRSAATSRPTRKPASPSASAAARRDISTYRSAVRHSSLGTRPSGLTSGAMPADSSTPATG